MNEKHLWILWFIVERLNGPSRESTSITASSAAEAIEKFRDWKEAKVYACVREDMLAGLS